ncbi:MAG: hypothetical protein HUJ69_03550 [Lachnospiraceae bacterium]|nr:hypothetical protein [Lachnospiraceae bacterium]
MKHKFSGRVMGLFVILLMLCLPLGAYARVVVTAGGTSIFEGPFTQSKGSTGIMVIPVQFSDTWFEDETADSDLIKAFFRDGGTEVPSLQQYYENASYGTIYPDVIVQRVVTLENSREFYQYDTRVLVEEALWQISERGVALSSFDENYDGYMDALYIVVAGDEGYDGFWAPHTDLYYDTYYMIDTGIAGAAFLPMSAFTSGAEEDSMAAVRETGYLMGLSDLRGRDASGKVVSGTGADTLMDLSVGDIDCFSKLLLGWNAPQVTSSSGSFRITSASVSDQALMVVPDGWDGNILSEYFMVEYVTPQGNQAQLPLGEEGAVRIWHVNAGTDTFTNDITPHMYLASNDSENKLLTMADPRVQWYGAGDEAGTDVLCFYDGTDSGFRIKVASLDGTAAVIEISKGQGQEPESSSGEENASQEASETTDESSGQEQEKPGGNEGTSGTETDPAEYVVNRAPIFSVSVDDTILDNQVKGKVELKKPTVSMVIFFVLILVVCFLLLRAARNYKPKTRRRR